MSLKLPPVCCCCCGVFFSESWNSNSRHSRSHRGSHFRRSRAHSFPTRKAVVSFSFCGAFGAVFDAPTNGVSMSISASFFFSPCSCCSCSCSFSPCSCCCCSFTGVSGGICDAAIDLSTVVQSPVRYRLLTSSNSSTLHRFRLIQRLVQFLQQIFLRFVVPFLLEPKVHVSRRVFDKSSTRNSLAVSSFCSNTLAEI